MSFLRAQITGSRRSSMEVEMKKDTREWLGIVGQWTGVFLFLFIIFKYVSMSAPWQYSLPLIAGWGFAIATKIRGK